MLQDKHVYLANYAARDKTIIHQRPLPSNLIRIPACLHALKFHTCKLTALLGVAAAKLAGKLPSCQASEQYSSSLHQLKQLTLAA
jgi:hypothetical protein